MRRLVWIGIALFLVTIAVLVAVRRGDRPFTPEHLYTIYYENPRQMGLDEPFNGVVRMIRDGEVIYEGAHGYADESGKRALTLEDRFLVGSSAKPITAILVMLQVESGEISLDDTLERHLEEWPVELASQIKLRHLLAHSSGLPRTRTDPEKVELASVPGEEYRFSNFGYELLIQILERSSGQSYAQLVQDRLVTPLKLSATGFAAGDALAQQVASGLEFEMHDFPAVLFMPTVGRHRELSLPTEGAVYSSLDDVQRIVAALRTNELLSNRSRELIFTAGAGGACFGWHRNRDWAVRSNPGAPLVTHVGLLNGHSSLIALYDDGTEIYLLSNAESLDVEKVLHESWLAAHGLEKAPSSIGQPSLSNARKFARDGGVAAYLDYYDGVSETAGYAIHPEAWSIEQAARLAIRSEEYDGAMSLMRKVGDEWSVDSPSMLNTVGYLFLQNKRYDDAIELFSRNCELFPEDANAYDSLGDAYENRGDLEPARDAYRQAIALAKKNGDRQLDFYERRLAGVGVDD